MSASVAADLQRGVRLEKLTVTWMIIEAVGAIVAGILAGSLLLTAFGFDSVIELVSGAVLLWRLSVQAHGGSAVRVDWAERWAARAVAVALTLLCVYVLGSTVYGLAARSRPEASGLGIAISLAAVVVMPWLAVAKRRVARRIDSDALAGDATNSLTCGYMAAAVLLGLLLDARFAWWWAEDVAGLVFLLWLLGETREAFEAARDD